MSDFTARLNEAITLGNAGRRDEARALLLELSREQPDSEAVWLCLSVASRDTNERVTYLRRVLNINPGNEKARAALLRLTGSPNQPPSRPPDVIRPKAGRGIEMTVLLLLAGLAVFVLGLLGWVALRPALFPPPEPTPFPTLTTLLTTPTVTPTFTDTPSEPALTQSGPTLPFTWTPAPSETPMPTRTPPPTLTLRPTSRPSSGSKRPTQSTAIKYPAMPSGLDRGSVIRVVDGDTVIVSVNGREERVRSIGIDTPESVAPNQPVECFGIESSNRAKALLSGQTVYLERDNSQGDRDRYDRLLRFIWLADGQLFELEMVAEGYAYEYTYNLPYKYQTQLRAAQRQADQANRGLWSPDTCNGRR